MSKILLIFFLVLSLSYSSIDYQIPANLNVSSLETLSINSFTTSSPNVESGSSIDFILELENIGNLISTASALVYIYNFSGDLVENFSYVNSTLVPLDTQILSKSWSATLPAGTYVAYSNVSFNGSITNMNTTFQITPTSNDLLPPNGEDNDNDNNVNIRKDGIDYEVPISYDPPKTNPTSFNFVELKLLKQPIFKEVIAGENTLIFPFLENSKDDFLVVDILPSGSGSIFSEDVAGVFLPKNSKKSIPIPLEIPDNTPNGFYTINLDFVVDDNVVSVPLILSVVDSKPTTVKREINLDLEQQRSIIKLELSNNNVDTLEYVQIYDELPEVLDLNAEIYFVNKPSQLLNDQTFRWDFENLFPKETRSIAYEYDSIPEDISKLFTWPIAQTNLIDRKSDRRIIVEDVKISTFLPGENSRFNLKLFNTGSIVQNVEVILIPPKELILDPESFEIEINPRESVYKSILIKTDPEADSGSYGFTVHLNYLGGSDDRTFFITVNEPIVAGPLEIPPIETQIQRWAEKNLVLILLIITFTLSVLLLSRAGYRKLRAPRYSKKRKDYMDGIKKMFK